MIIAIYFKFPHPNLKPSDIKSIHYQMVIRQTEIAAGYLPDFPGWE
jgi:hypothetical protein